MALEVGPLGRCFGHGGETLINRISALLKSQERLAPPSTEDTVKGTICESRCEPSPAPDPLVPDLGLPLLDYSGLQFMSHLLCAIFVIMTTVD